MTKMIQRSHPDAEKINPILHNIIVERSNKLDKGALMTNWDCFSIPEFISIADYARSLTEQPSQLVDLWGQLIIGVIIKSTMTIERLIGHLFIMLIHLKDHLR